MRKSDEIKSFRDLLVWQKAFKLFLQAVKDIERFPKTRSANMISGQLLRSTSSISANIAEGFGRHKGKEFQRYLKMSRGSTTESEDWYIKCGALNFINKITFEKRFQACEEIRIMLNSFIGSLRKPKVEEVERLESLESLPH